MPYESRLRYPPGSQVSGLAGSLRRARVGKRAGAGVLRVFRLVCSVVCEAGEEGSLFGLGGWHWREAFGLDAALAGELGLEGSIKPWRFKSKEGHGLVCVSCASTPSRGRMFRSICKAQLISLDYSF